MNVRGLRLVSMATLITILTSHPASSQDVSENVDVADIADTKKPPTASTLVEAKALGQTTSVYRAHVVREVDTEAPEPRLNEFQRQILPVLQSACTDCHGADAQEGNFRIDTLDPNLLQGQDVDWWIEVVNVLSNGEMPPDDASELSVAERGRIIEWLSTEIQVASLVRRNKQAHSSFRRMTRYETNYALQDLLNLPYDFADDLPPENFSPDGFQNSSDVLQISASQFETYLELSRRALMKATVRGPASAPLYWAVSMKKATEQMRASYEAELEKKKARWKDDPEKLRREIERHAASHDRPPRGAFYKDISSGLNFKASWQYRGARYAWTPSTDPPSIPSDFTHVAVIPPRQKLIVELGDRIPDSGTLRVRIRAARSASDETSVPSLRMELGFQASNNSSASGRITETDIAIMAAPGAPQFYEWNIPLSEITMRNPMRGQAKLGETPNPSEYLKLHNTAIANGDVLVDYIEIAAPAESRWPPESHERVFAGDLLQGDESSRARMVLAGFMARAWRRPVTDREIDQKVKLFATIRPACGDFQEAMIEVLATVLASPNFLYLSQSTTDTVAPSPILLTDHELATRLSMFLWCSVPDQELMQTASSGALRDPRTLRHQTDRMLADDRSQRLTHHFVRQWLGMQLLDYLNVDASVYPQMDPYLKEAMQHEPIAFFNEVLQQNASVIDFLHADYAVVNERLAQHYGINDVYGSHFRRVAIDPRSRRGGLLTQAGLLAMNSDGKDSHPLKRGIWLLERILNDPPPPPPPAVPEIDLTDPNIAKMTLKERIEDHRNDPACLSCHAKIDPWGIAFENYDAIGRWRNKINDRSVDANSNLYNGQTLDGIDGLKRFLLEHRQDQFARSITQKLTTFALGRPLTFSDRAAIDDITAETRQQGDGLATLLHKIIASDLFQNR